MKITVAKRDLDSAITTASIGLAGSGTDITTHFVFRVNGESVEVLSYDGRSGVSTGIICELEIEENEEDSFTIEGWRLKQWLSAVEDSALTLRFKNRVVTAKAPRGSVRFSSLDPAEFPYWDEQIDQAQKPVAVKADRMHSAYSHAKLFLADKTDTRTPELALTQLRDSIIWSAELSALSMIKLKKIRKGVSLKVHGRDIPTLLSFLGRFGSDTVEFLPHDRGLFVRAPDGSVLTLGMPRADFPTTVEEPDSSDPYWWSFSAEDLRRSIQILLASAAREDVRVNFKLDKSKVVLSMKATSESADTNNALQITCKDHGEQDKHEYKPIPSQGFALNAQSLLKFLGKFEEDELKMGIYPSNPDANVGWVSFAEEKHGDTYRTNFVWMKPAP